MTLTIVFFLLLCRNYVHDYKLSTKHLSLLAINKCDQLTYITKEKVVVCAKCAKYN